MCYAREELTFIMTEQICASQVCEWDVGGVKGPRWGRAWEQQRFDLRLGGGWVSFVSFPPSTLLISEQTGVSTWAHSCNPGMSLLIFHLSFCTPPTPLPSPVVTCAFPPPTSQPTLLSSSLGASFIFSLVVMKAGSSRRPICIYITRVMRSLLL